MASDVNRLRTTELLQVQRGMTRIATQPVVALVRDALDSLRQSPIATPESRGSAISHRSVVRP